MSEKKILERLKFYADTPKAEANKYFCWDLTSIATLQHTLWSFFDKGWNIRAAWYEKIDCSSGEVLENTKLNIVSEMEEHFESKKSHLLTKK